MSASKKIKWGIILNVLGSILTVGGLALSVSLVGACVGIPMIVVGLPMNIWGIVWYLQGRSDRQRESISEGIRDGLQELQQASQSSKDEKEEARPVLPLGAPESEAPEEQSAQEVEEAKHEWELPLEDDQAPFGEDADSDLSDSKQRPEEGGASS